VGLVTLAPLRHPPFRRFWIGAAVSNIGTWMETVALGYYVADQTRMAVWSAVIAAAAFIPIAVIGPIGGALADRRSRKTILLLALTAQTLIAAVVAALVAAEAATPGTIALLTLASGCAAAIGFPSYQASFRHLVPPEDLPAAIGLASAQWNLGRILGPVAAAVAISVGGIAWALVINTLSFLAVIGAVASVRLPRPALGRATEPFRRAILGGWRHVRAEPGLRATFSIMCLNTFLAAPFIALIPAMAVKVLDGDETTTGLLVTAQGVGAVLAGATVGGLVARYGIRLTMTRAVGLTAPALALYGVAPTLASMAAALAVVGFLYMLALSTFSTAAQQRSPDEVVGRVLAVNNAVLGALYPLGALVQGRLADTIGLRTTTVAAALLLAAALAGLQALRPGYTSPLATPVLVS
jgi:predicted MFS family arabinose efflux permease